MVSRIECGSRQVFVLRATQLIGLLLINAFVISLSATHVCAAGWPAKAPSLPPPQGNVVRVSDVESLQQAVRELVSGTTILVEPGEYRLTETLIINGPDNVAIRGASGNRDDVVIRGKGMLEKDYGKVEHVIRIRKSVGILIADLTLADSWYHLIQIQGEYGSRNLHAYNVHFLDSGEQMLKATYNPKSKESADSGLVEYCRFEYTDRSKNWYTNGVDVLLAKGWVVRNNEFIRIRGPVGELCGSAVLFFGRSQGALIERNYFYNCDVAIGAGIFSGEEPYSHRGSLIRNNIIFRDEPGGGAGIEVGYTPDYKIYHNTIIQNSFAPYAILYGDNISSGEIYYNLTDGPFQAVDDTLALDPWSPELKEKKAVYRPSGKNPAHLKGNVTNARSDWFVAAQKGDLHLSAGAAEALDKAAPLDLVKDDYDGQPRPAGALSDIGADEYNP